MGSAAAALVGLPLGVLALLLHAQPARAQYGAPAYCPAAKLTSCKNMKDLKCHPTIWHGIDSLEGIELTPLNSSAVRIRSLNGSFAETVGTVTIAPKTGTFLPGQPLHCVEAPPISTREGNCTTRVSAYFSDVGRTLISEVMESCGIISWVNGHGLWGDWVHADIPHESPAKEMCVWNASAELYHEVSRATPSKSAEGPESPRFR